LPFFAWKNQKVEIAVDLQVLIYKCLWVFEKRFSLKILQKVHFFLGNKNLFWCFALFFAPAYDVR